MKCARSGCTNDDACVDIYDSPHSYQTYCEDCGNSILYHNCKQNQHGTISQFLEGKPHGAIVVYHDGFSVTPDGKYISILCQSTDKDLGCDFIEVHKTVRQLLLAGC